jgi:hypothetical protein
MATAGDAEARGLENRGRLWLVVSYLLCPCHLPVSMALLGAAFGGTAVGAAVTGNAWRTGLVLGALYVLALWRGFRSLRRAKARLAPGERLDCSGPDATCEVVPAGEPVAVSR